MTMVISGSEAGAEIITLRAPAARCFEALSRFVKIPVHSATMSTPKPFQSMDSGSFTDVTMIDLPFTSMAPSLGFTSASSLPCTES